MINWKVMILKKNIEKKVKGKGEGEETRITRQK